MSRADAHSGKASREMNSGRSRHAVDPFREVSPAGPPYTFARATCRHCSTRTAPEDVSAPWAAAPNSRSPISTTPLTLTGRPLRSVPRWKSVHTRQFVRIARQRAMVKTLP